MPVITVMQRPSEGFRFNMILITQIYRTIKQSLHASYITYLLIVTFKYNSRRFYPLEYLFTLGQSHYTLFCLVQQIVNIPPSSFGHHNNWSPYSYK